MIQFKQIVKTYQERIVVKNLNLEITEGELFVLLGESGSGKTTSLKMVNGLVKPDSGQVLVNNINIAAIADVTLRKNIGYVMQYYGLFPHYTVSENIAIVPKLLNWQKDKIVRRTAELMRVFGLEPELFLRKLPHELSGGQQQRIGMIRALMASPPVLLMDEPLGALDPLTRNSIRNEFKTLEELKNKTILMVTHDIPEAFMLADRIGLMHEGQCIQVGKPIDFLINPASQTVSDFFSTQVFSLMLLCIKLKDLIADLKSVHKKEIIFSSVKHTVDPDCSISGLIELLSINPSLYQLIEWKSSNGADFLVLSKEMLMSCFFNHLGKTKFTANQHRQ